MTDRKVDKLLSRLQSGWCSVSDLTSAFEVQPHSLRASISGLKKNHNVERQRVEGVTSYRIAPAGIEAAE